MSSPWHETAATFLDGPAIAVPIQQLGSLSRQD